MRRLKTSELFLYFPERNNGELVGKLPPFTEKSDVYALGTLFWEIAERRTALSEVYGMRRFQVSEQVPLTYRIWIEWCRAMEPEKRPLTGPLFEELSNRETQQKLLEEADKRLALTTIVLEEGTVFPDLFEKVHEIPNLEQFGEIHLYNRSQSPHLIALLQTAPPSERLDYARTTHLLSIFWETF